MWQKSSSTAYTEPVTGSGAAVSHA